MYGISALYNTSLQEFLKVSLKVMCHPQNSFFTQKSAIVEESQKQLGWKRHSSSANDF